MIFLRVVHLFSKRLGVVFEKHVFRFELSEVSFSRDYVSSSRLLENHKWLLENTNQSSAGESPARESPARESPARESPARESPARESLPERACQREPAGESLPEDVASSEVP